jgi:hypothetical protein
VIWDLLLRAKINQRKILLNVFFIAIAMGKSQRKNFPCPVVYDAVFYA